MPQRTSRILLPDPFWLQLFNGMKPCHGKLINHVKAAETFHKTWLNVSCNIGRHGVRLRHVNCALMICNECHQPEASANELNELALMGRFADLSANISQQNEGSSSAGRSPEPQQVSRGIKSHLGASFHAFWQQKQQNRSFLTHWRQLKETSDMPAQIYSELHLFQRDLKYFCG